MEMTANVTLKTGKDKVRASASLTLGKMVVIYDIRVIEGNSGLFVAMPSRRERGGERWVDVVRPFSAEARTQVEALILEEYQKKQQAASRQDDAL